MSWHESALLSQNVYRNALKQIGLDPKTTQDEIHRYNAEGYPLSRKTWARLSRSKRRGCASRFADFFLARYRYEAIEHKDIAIDVPIFKLHSPKVKGSKVVYTEQHATTDATSWSVQLFGIGIGATQAFHLQNKMTFTSTEGACKLVRLPVVLRITRMKVYRKRRFIKEMLSVETAPEMEREIVHEGVKRQREHECLKAVASHDGKPERFPCAENDSLTRCERTWSSSRDRRFVSEIGAFNMKAPLNAQIHRETIITLQFELPGRHDYRMVPLELPDGLRFEVLRESRTQNESTASQETKSAQPRVPGGTREGSHPLSRKAQAARSRKRIGQSDRTKKG